MPASKAALNHSELLYHGIGMARPTPSAVILVIDQGTSSTRAVLYDRQAKPVAVAQRELPQSYPQAGWVEHDAEQIWRHCLACCREVLAASQTQAIQLQAMGITNQRETIVLWDRASGLAIAPALVWQDRRTADRCQELVERGHESAIRQKTGLLLDAYFSASKLQWLLDHVPQARERAEAGLLAAGTIDSFLLHKFSGGRVHATDATNASRTLLFNIHRQEWDDELLQLFQIPRQILPLVKDTCAEFAQIDAEHLGAEISLTCMVGDQQAAAIGQGCTRPGMMKSTYGTGCFALRNCGTDAPVSKHRLLTTIAQRIDGTCTYALEGSIFNAGTTIQWLRDQLNLMKQAGDSEQLARKANPHSAVIFVPAFTGMGAPHWNPHARGALLGLTRDSGPPEIVRAGLEAVAWQTFDLIAAIEADCGSRPEILRVDGGMANNDWLLQFIADVLDLPVERPQDFETTALGACLLAGQGARIWPNAQEDQGFWRLDRVFSPNWSPTERLLRLEKWHAAIQCILGFRP
jgi:glycerol kinase